LDISRIEAGALTISLEPVSLRDVTTEVASLIMPLSQQRDISVSLELGEFQTAHVLADRQRLTQIILNLVSNGVKYNRKSGSLRIRASELPDSHVRISVTDTGPGIPPERAHQIFQPFERLGAEVTSIEGTGLGLALSKRLVEAMGGSIGFETGEGGTSFYVDLPAVQSQMSVLDTVRPDTPEVAALIGSAERKVLLIEDNMSNIRLMEKIFQSRPQAKLLVAMQGHLGYELAVQHLPDLILLDLNLPDCHGIDLLQRLKGLDETADIPIVVVSADATQAQIARLISTGALKYLTKPVNVRELLTTVDEVFVADRMARRLGSEGPDPDGPDVTGVDKVA
jgi:CheY-like chemotaxis protein/two-component sensor histidine kinase